MTGTVTPFDFCVCNKCGPPWRFEEPNWAEDSLAFVSWMSLCPLCGNKRCPGALDHNNPCDVWGEHD